MTRCAIYRSAQTGGYRDAPRVTGEARAAHLEHLAAGLELGDPNREQVRDQGPECLPGHHIPADAAHPHG